MTLLCFRFKLDLHYIFPQIEFSYTFAKYRFNHTFIKNIMKSMDLRAIFQASNCAKMAQFCIDYS